MAFILLITNAYSYISMETHPPSILQKGSPLDVNVNITFDYPLPLEANQTNLTVKIWNTTYPIGIPNGTKSMPLAPKIIELIGAEEYTFYPKYFNFTVNLTGQNITYTPVSFNYSVERRLYEKETPTPSQSPQPPKGGDRKWCYKVFSDITKDDFINDNFHKDVDSCDKLINMEAIVRATRGNDDFKYDEDTNQYIGDLPNTAVGRFLTYVCTNKYLELNDTKNEIDDCLRFYVDNKPSKINESNVFKNYTCNFDFNRDEHGAFYKFPPNDFEGTHKECYKFEIYLWNGERGHHRLVFTRGNFPYYNAFDYMDSSQPGEMVYPGGNLWKAEKANPTNWAPKGAKLTNYCSGPEDFEGSTGEGTRDSLSCDGSSIQIMVNNKSDHNFEPDPFSNSITYTGCEDGTSYHFSAYVLSKTILDITFDIEVNDGMSMYLDDERKIVCGCVTEKECENNKKKACPGQKLRITPGLHKLDIYFYNKDEGCSLRILTRNFDDLCKKVGKNEDCEYFYKLFEGWSKTQPDKKWRGVSDQVSVSVDEGLKEVGGFERYLETGEYRDLRVTSNPQNADVDISLRMACGNQVYGKCVQMGGGSTCTTDKYGWVKNRVLSIEDNINWEYVKECGQSNVDDVKFYIEPFDNNSLDLYRNKYRPDGKPIGGVYKCKGFYKEGCDYDYNGMCCFYQPWYEGSGGQGAGWSGYDSSKNTGTITICDYDQTYTYIVNYLTYQGPDGNFTMFKPELPKFCAYTSSVGSSPAKIDKEINFTNVLCNQTTGLGKCCVCTSQKECKLECVNCIKLENGNCVDYIQLVNNRLNPFAFLGSPSGTTQEGYRWEINTSSLNVSIKTSDEDINMSAEKKQPDPINNPTNLWWDLKAEWFRNYRNLLFQNYTVIVNLYRDFRLYDYNRSGGFLVPDWEWRHKNVDTRGGWNVPGVDWKGETRNYSINITLSYNTSNGILSNLITTNFTAVECMSPGQRWSNAVYNYAFGGTPGIGICKAGTLTCSNNHTWFYNLTSDMPVYPQLEVCNGIDDDCNGIIDDIGGIENLINKFRQYGGKKTFQEITKCGCFNGAQPKGEICNDIDDDCDGVVDNRNKIILINTCDDAVKNCMALGNPYVWCANIFYNSSSCGFGYKTIFMPETIYINPCTEAVKKCTQTGYMPGGVGPQRGHVAEMSGYGLQNPSGKIMFDGIRYNPFINFTYDQCKYIYMNPKCEIQEKYVSVLNDTCACSDQTSIPIEAKEVCNGIDDDCNGIIDDVEYPTTCACSMQTNISLIHQLKKQSNDTCNGIDDNCNGKIDENAPNCACTNREAKDVINISAVREICDYVDNNCNGLVDENFPNLGKGCGTGACQGGVYVCGVHGDEVVCNTTVPAEETFKSNARNFVSNELCDLIDNNCDYSIDEECGCTPSDIGVAKICGYDSRKYYKSMEQIETVCNYTLDMIAKVISWENAPGNSKYRRLITIENENPADLRNYPVYIELDTEYLIKNGKLRPDAGDLRIVDENGNVLDWFMEVPDRTREEQKVELSIGDEETRGSKISFVSNAENIIKDVAASSANVANANLPDISRNAERLAANIESIASRPGISTETKNLLEKRSSEIKASIEILNSAANELKKEVSNVQTSVNKESVNALVNKAENVQNAIELISSTSQILSKEMEVSREINAQELQNVNEIVKSISQPVERTEIALRLATQMQSYLGKSKIWFKINIKPNEKKYYYVYYGDPSATYTMRPETEIKGLTKEREMFFLCHFDNSYACDGNFIPMLNQNTSFTRGVYGSGVLINREDILKYPTSENINKERGTIAFWVKTGSGYIFHEKDFGNRDQINIYIENSNLFFEIYDLSGNRHYLSTPITNSWTRVAASWDVLKGMSLYINGEMKANRSETWRMNNLSVDFWLGSKSGENVLNGVIDEFVIYTYHIDEEYAKRESRAYAIKTETGPEEDLSTTIVREKPREIFEKCNQFLGSVAGTILNTTKAATILSLCDSILICNKTFNINPRSRLTLGLQYCQNGKWGECTGLIEPETEVCNGIDDDGNGIVDDVQFPETCGCYNPINLSIGNPPKEEVCNGIDDDCNGIIDDVGGLVNPNLTYCACTNRTVNVTTKPFELEPNLCNGIDDNCNGIIDENVDNCACSGTNFWNISQARGPEICNYIDDNCNGQIDETFRRQENSSIIIPYLGDPCGYMNSLCVGGTYICSSTGTELVCSTTTPPERSWGKLSVDLRKEERSNGIDDDCNGIIDDIYGNESGKYVQCYQGRSPQIEICNGRDDDCDGIVDDNLTACACSGFDELNASSADYIISQIKLKKLSGEICNNIDDNCNGKIDEGLNDCACSEGYAGDPSLRPEICNGIDDNCNGIVDDVDTPEKCACYNGSHRSGEVSELCNGIDDNCNGLIDELWPQIGQGCSIGICSGGVYTCDGNKAICSSASKATQEICDGLDNDCDGSVDENCPCSEGENRTCGFDKGICKAGVQICSNGKWSECTNAVLPGIEICNGLDDDCDGIIDNIGGKNSIESTKCGCFNGAQPKGEICNDIDDDCNGIIDDINGGNSIESTKCGCYGNGYGVGSRIEICNGIDDDCNGIIDDINGGNSIESTKCGCYGGQNPSREVCNLIDDDCNNAIDELWPELGNDCGTGICAGRYVCSGGGVICNGAKPETEICDSKDNNCDGRIDEGCYVGSYTISTCENGVKDGDEEGVDCGGSCSRPCEIPKKPPISWITIFLILMIIIIIVGLILAFMK